MTTYGHPRTHTRSPRRCLLFMPLLDEDLIERFVRYPGTLTPSARAAVEELLSSSAAARELAAFFRTYYEELDELNEPYEELDEFDLEDQPRERSSEPPPSRGAA